MNPKPMTTRRKAALIIGLSFGLFLVPAGITAAILDWQPGLLNAFGKTTRTANPDPKQCKTIATDPNPPLNVRSSPVVAPDNIVGKLQNGTRLTVIDENEGWLSISSPIQGWVFKDLTVTSCTVAGVSGNNAAEDDGTKTLTEATEIYQSGRLEAAIALAKTIPTANPDHAAAERAIEQWRQDWATAETKFLASQSALRDGNWQAVLQSVNGFPDNRYWRARLTPLVKEAIKRQSGADSAKLKMQN